ncbi:MAG: beta-N-acetylhexosaminidase, partial [Bacteroidota bacterium]
MLFCLGLLIGSPHSLFSQIIPQPQRIKYAEGSFSFPEKVGISLINDPLASNLYTAQEINKSIREKLARSTYLETKTQKAPIILSLISEEDALRQGIPVRHLQQSYRLTIINDKILIEASHPQGIFYGAQSLSQLIRHMSGNALQNQQILDWPKFEWRGMTEDLSRGQIPKKETFHKIIDFMARYKMNYYLFYLEDNLKIDAYSEFGEDVAKLSKADVKELVAYARKKFITIIPYFPVIGHQAHLLGQSAFSQMAEFPGAASFCVDCPLTYSFLEKVLNEIQDTFD